MSKLTLTIYSNNYDSYSYVVGRGMSGKVFIENGKTGREFRSAEQAIDFAVKNNMKLEEICYCYQVNGQQLFKKFAVS